MSNTKLSPGIVSSRLSKEDYLNNFSDAYPGFTNYEAKVEADRCYFCYDAPCISACPTEINIPLFIRQISTEMEDEAAKTIFDQNILGGMCARVCPTETLCEEACVLQENRRMAAYAITEITATPFRHGSSCVVLRSDPTARPSLRHEAASRNILHCKTPARYEAGRILRSLEGS